MGSTLVVSLALLLIGLLLTSVLPSAVAETWTEPVQINSFIVQSETHFQVWTTPSYNPEGCSDNNV